MLRYWGTLVLLLLATPVLVQAQNTGKLSGRILDGSTGEPLPGANVLLLGTQLGTITDVEGNYFIIGVPVGEYDVQASFVGFQPQTVQNVEINAGYTRELNFTLSPGVELNEIVVEYERPLIQKDAIGAPRVVTGEEIENLPIRGVANVAALQSGVVANEGSSSLFVRGGREQEVAYYVDGVKVVGALAVPQQAIQEQEMLIGAIPARYGDAMGGIISVTTKTGTSQRGFFGTIEALSSQVLDSYGYNLGSISIGGPIAPRKASFFISAEGLMMEDTDPFAKNILQLSDDAYAQLWQNPQVLQVEGPDANKDGKPDVSYIPFPTDIRPGFSEASLDSLLAARQLLAADQHVADHTPRFATDLFTADRFESRANKDFPYRRLNLNGNLTLTPVQSVNLRVGGAYETSQDDLFNYSRSLYNRDRFYNSDRNTWRAFGTWRQYLSNSTFYEVGVNYNDYKGWTYPNGFSKDVEDALFYGDADGVVLDANGNVVSQTPAYETNAVVRNYWQLSGAGAAARYQPQYVDGSFPSGSGVYSMFAVPGSMISEYIKFHRQQFRLNANATTQIGIHQIEFGGEYEQRTWRQYDVLAGSLARYFSDGKQETATETPVNSWGDLPAKVVESSFRSGETYGYDIYGLKETDEDDIESFAEYILSGGTAGANTLNIAPHKPIYYAGYIQDKIEFRDLIINLGLRVDVFDNNTLVLRDPYAAVPIVRANAIANRPGNIGEDFAVYFPDGNPTNAPIGYRDLDGNFYDTEGQRSSFDVLGPMGTVSRDTQAKFTSIFKDYKPQVTFMPRIGVSFPVTDQALFFASYNVLTQRPSEEAFVPPQTYVGLGNEYISNPNLKPETTTQYELGFRQRLGARAALQLSGFYRTQNNKIQIRSLPSGIPVHNSYYNVDFTTTKGATIEFDLRRTNNLSMNANYTLSYAQGTGSDAGTMQTIAWRGDYFPNFIAPAEFDRRHTFNVRLDYRLGEGDGPEILGARLLENFGVNIIGSVKSGMPYTQLRVPVSYPVYQDVTDPASGGLNGAYMPWSTLVDLNIDRRFALGNVASLTAFLQVQNLFDVDNILGVYRGTGLPDNDGYLDTKGGIDFANSSFSPDSYRFHYRTLVSNPLGSGDEDFAGARAWGLPRRTRLGVRFNF